MSKLIKFEAGVLIVSSDSDGETQGRIQAARGKLHDEGLVVVSLAVVPFELYEGDDIRVAITYCKPDKIKVEAPKKEVVKEEIILPILVGKRKTEKKVKNEKK